MIPISEPDLHRLIERGLAFSIVEPDRFQRTAVMFGPARCANHDCQSNSRLIASSRGFTQVIATEDIAPGTEITVNYGEAYFGEDNSACLCETCQSANRETLSSSAERTEMRQCVTCGTFATGPMSTQSQCLRCIRHRRIYKVDWPARKVKKVVEKLDENGSRTIKPTSKVSEKKTRRVAAKTPTPSSIDDELWLEAFFP